MARFISIGETLRDDLANGEVLGVSIAVVLVIVLVATLRGTDRRLARQPVLLLTAHFALEATSRLWESSARLRSVLSVLALLFLLASIGRASVVLVLDVLFGRRMRARMPKIIRDVVQSVVYTAALLVSLHAAGVDPGSLLTTSALLTAVIGLSLQETLGYLLAGLAIQAQRPFDVGDWIQFDDDPRHVGRVLEISWRATKILTADEVELTVPNGTLGKAPIANFSKPRPRVRRAISIVLPTSIPPRRAQRILADAACGAWGVLDDPPISVVTSQFADSGVEYTVRFWTTEFQRRDVVDGGARDRVWYALARAGIPIPSPQREVLIHHEDDASRAAKERTALGTRIASLRGVDFLAALEGDDLARLAAAAREEAWAAGETILRKGDTSSDLLIVKAGSVSVLVPGKNGDQEVARLGPGEFFGEMALLTGEPRNATVIAAVDTELFALGQDDVKAILELHPALAETISRALAERQAKLEAHIEANASGDNVEARTSLLLGRIKRFFKL